MINNRYQNYGIFTSGEPTLAELKQLIQVYGVKSILSLDRDAGSKVANLIKLNNLPVAQRIYHIDPGSPAGQASNLFNNILSVILGNAQNPILIHCKAGKDRTGFAVAAWLIKSSKAMPCDAINQVESTIGYGTGGISTIAKNSMDRVLGCGETVKTEEQQETENELVEQATDVNDEDIVSEMRDNFGQQQMGLTSGTTDGGFWADNIGFANNWSDVDMEKYPAVSRAARRVLKRMVRIAKKKDLIPGGLADNTTKKFDKNQMEKGKKVEMEHTNNPAIAEEIAEDHLTEFDKYYDALEEMEKKLESDVNDAYLGGGPNGSPTAEAQPGEIPEFILNTEKRNKRRAKLLKMLEKINEEEVPEQLVGLGQNGQNVPYMGSSTSNIGQSPSHAPGAPNAASPEQSAGYVQL